MDTTSKELKMKQTLIALSSYATHKPYTIEQWLQAREDEKVGKTLKKLRNEAKVAVTDAVLRW